MAGAQCGGHGQVQCGAGGAAQFGEPGEDLSRAAVLADRASGQVGQQPHGLRLAVLRQDGEVGELLAAPVPAVPGCGAGAAERVEDGGETPSG
ncbi:hypothetical protein Scinn_56710 [Streptomyces virginiae]|uniref:Uncharacterized protein n=1 Tax=Streptomyces virginiae TaxID=1961 RepID=A0ABQ3NTZ1_STRVG|nr:hypothetical protein Scinn_56710 [Streptomyces virginiae]